MSRRRALLLACGVSVGAAACHPAPERTLDAYLAHVAAKRTDAAWALLSSEYQKSHDKAAFARELARTGEPPAPAHGPSRTEYRAEVELAGARVPLVLEGGAWRLAHDPLDVYPQATPDEALRSFLRALDRHRYDVLLRFVPSRYRATITVEKLRERWEGAGRADLLQQAANAQKHLGEPFELAATGEEARLPLGDLKAVRMVREDGTWRLLDLE